MKTITAAKRVLGSKLLDEILAAIPALAPPTTPGAVVGLPEVQISLSATDSQVVITLPDSATQAQLDTISNLIAAHSPTPLLTDPDLTLPQAIKDRINNDQDLTPAQLRRAVRFLVKRLGGLQ